ncbi:MAG: holin family protein [Oscillospiraceae bacterium]
MTCSNIIRTCSAALGAVIGFLYGEINGLFIAIIALMALDYITGIMCAVSTKTLSSEVGFKGLVKKLMILVIIAVGHLVDAYIIGTGSAFMTAVILFFAANEGISIIENAAALGLPVPKKLRNVLEQLRSEEDKEDDDG